MCRKWAGQSRLLLARPRSISAHALWSRDRSVRMRCDMTLSHGLNWPIFDQWEHRTTKTNPNYRHEVIDGVLFKMDRRSEFRVWKKLSHKIFFLVFLMFQIKTSHFNAVTCRTGATSDHVRDKWPVYWWRTRQVTGHKAGRTDRRTSTIFCEEVKKLPKHYRVSPLPGPPSRLNPVELCREARNNG